MQEIISIQLSLAGAMAAMLRSSWRFSPQLPTWSRKVFSLSAVRAGGRATRSVSSRSAPSSQRAAAMAAADNIIEGQQAAIDVAEYPLKEAARPFSDIPGKIFYAER